MAYLEISPMENHAERLAKQLDTVLEAKPAIYSKTRDRYQKLAYSLLQSVERISAILEEESLVSSITEDEFDELSSNTSSTVLSNKIDDVKEQMSSVDAFTSSSVSTSFGNKDILSSFAVVMKDSKHYDFGVEEANMCANLISRWFEARFTPNVKNPKFRYQIDQIPKWIAYIIIVFGNYHSKHQLPAFTSAFDSWIHDIESNNTNCWAVPYEVHQVMKKVQPEYYTLDSVVIADILFDGQYYKLTSSTLSTSDVTLESNSVVSLVKHNNPTILPKIRTRIAKQKELIEELHMTRTEGGYTVE